MTNEELFPYRFVPDAVPAIVEEVCDLWRESEAALAEGPQFALKFADKAVLFRLFDNFFLWATQSLKVEDKMTQELIAFRFKPVQREIAMVILHDWIAELPVRLVVLKARREGVSTLTQAFFAWLSTLRRNRKGLTIAQDDDTAQTIHRMQETFYDNLPELIQPMRGVSQAGRVLELSNPTKNRVEKRRNPGLGSWVRTGSLQNAGAGKGAAAVHLSEVGLWDPGKAPKAMTTVLQVVPKGPRTIVVQESTARGIGNLFHRSWTRAETGVSAYRPIFIGWQEEPTNRMAVFPGFTRTAEEEELAHAFDLDDEQLVWRRNTLENECSGDLDEFHQEYPMTPDEAFLASGRPFFDPKLVKRYYEQAKANETALMEAWPDYSGHLIEQDERDGVKGPWTIYVPARRAYTLRIFEPPDKDLMEDYLISADAAGGSPELSEIIVAGETSVRKARGDWHAAYVYKRSEMRIVAAWHGRVDRDEYADHLYRLGKLYAGCTTPLGRQAKGALVAIEITGGWGMAPLLVMKRRGYQRLYHRKIVENVHSREMSVQLGWETSIKTRPLVLDHIKAAMRTDAFQCDDQYLYGEMGTFIYNESGKPEAMAGTFDDRIFAAAVGAYLWSTESRAFYPVAEEQRPLSSVTGY